MKQNSKLWIISELFYPDQTSTAFILNEVSDFLAIYTDVEVICGPVNYQKDRSKNSNSKKSKVKITRIKSLNLNKNNLLLRSIRLVILSFQLTIIYMLKSSKGDKVLIVTNPAPLLLFFAIISKFFKRRVVLLVHDVFPENTIPSQIISNQKSFTYKSLKKLFDYAYSQFETIIVLGRDMKKVLNDKIITKGKNTSKIEIIENWAETNDIFPLNLNNIAIQKWGVSKKFIFLFAGNMGRSQALEELFSIIRNVTNTFVHFVFLGDGALRAKLIQNQIKYNLSNITIGNSYSRSEQNNILNSCNAGIVSLAKGMEGLGVPSKSYNILAAGKPILYFGDETSEISLLVEENNVGWTFNDSNTLLEFFNQVDESYIEKAKVIGQKCRVLAESKYSKSIIINKYLAVI